MTADVRAAVDAWLGRAGTDAGRPALLARLAADPAFRRSFAVELHLLGLLQVARAGEPRWLRLENELDGPAPAPADPLEDAVMRRVEGSARRVRAALAAAGLAAAVGLAVALWPAPAVEVAEALVAGGDVAAVVAADGVDWEAGPAPAPGAVVPAGRLRFRAGRLTLALVNGVALTAEGPADLELRSAGEVVCHRGRLRSAVPPGAEGFTVRTPGAAVIDRGTEFGVNVGADGRAEVLVFRGLADVALLDSGGRPTAQESVSGGRAVEVDPGAAVIREARPAPERFARPADPPAPPLDLGPDYPAAVRASRPWAYWRFAAPDGGPVPSDAAGGPALTPLGGVRFEDAGGDGNRCAVFAPDRIDQALLADGAWVPPRAGGFAVEFWFEAERYTYATLAAVMAGPPGREDHTFQVEVLSHTPAPIHVPCAVRGLDRWPPGRKGGVNVHSARVYRPYRWHHVVAQRAGGRFDLYLDGELRSSPTAEPVASGECRVIFGRLRTGRQLLDGRDDLQQVRPFVGRLAEVAVYDHPLTADDVRDHLAAARATAD
jgi:ferric-dicitrate binding protein FerR (iron transport regulator)